MSLRDCFFGSVPTCAVRQAPSSSVYVLFDSDSINAVHVAKAKKRQIYLAGWQLQPCPFPTVSVLTLLFSVAISFYLPLFVPLHQ